MKRNNSFFTLIVTLLGVVLFCACNRQNKEATAENNSDTVVAADNALPEQPCDSVTLPESVILEEIQWHLDHGNIQEAEQWRSMLSNPPDLKPTPQKEKPKTPAKTQSKPANTGKQGTIYISTYGANGKVWGHVRMNGNTGRGTIHDDEENTLTISVTRHGNELFGTDQNGRQYVFKL